MNEVWQYLEANKERMIETLKTVVELESPSTAKHLTDRLADKIAELFRELTGGTAEVITNSTYGNHVRGEWGSGDEQILVLCHFDTVWPEGTLKNHPFRVDEEGKAYGPGIFDMKGGLVQGIYALHALKALNKQVGKRVVFLFNSDEEIGSPSSRQLIEAEAAKSKYVFVLECSSAPNGAAKTSRKGVGMFTLKVTGRSAHAGVDHARGRSAIEELARQIQYLHSLTDYETGTTVNVGMIKGGTARNVVAAAAEAEIDLRVKTMAEANRVIPLILGLKPQLDGTTVTVTGDLNRPPLERTEQVANLYNQAVSIAREQLEFTLEEQATGGGSDGNFTAPIAPTLDGIGAVGDGAHAAGEYVVLSEMPRRSALVALLIEKLA